MKIGEFSPWNNAREVIEGIWKADSLRGRFARGAVWSLAGALSSQGSNLAASVITARLLGTEEFGEFGIIQSTVGILGIFAGMGLGVTATKYVAEYRVRDPERAGRIVALGAAAALFSGALLALCLVIWAPELASGTLSRPSLSGELRIASVLLFLNAVNGAQMGALSGFEAFRTIARINFIRGLTTLPIAVTAVFYWKLPGAVWALCATSAVACLLSQIALRRHCGDLGIHVRLADGWAERRVLWTFSTPAFLSGALAGPAIWAANAMLVNQPAGYSEMGVFNAASQWRNAISFLPLVLTQFALPMLSSLNAERDVSRYGKALRWNLIITAGAAILAALPVALASGFIIELYGSGFEGGRVVLVIAAATAVVSCINGVVGTAIFSSGSVWAGLLFNTLWAAALLGSAYYFIPLSPAIGLAAAMLLAYLCHTVWQGVYLARVWSRPG